MTNRIKVPIEGRFPVMAPNSSFPLLGTLHTQHPRSDLLSRASLSLEIFLVGTLIKLLPGLQAF